MDKFIIRQSQKWGVVVRKLDIDINFEKRLIPIEKCGIFLKNSVDLDKTTIDYHKLIEAVQPIIMKEFKIDISKLSCVRKILIHYCDGGDVNLKEHIDDSLITVNFCVSDEYNGNELVFVNSEKIPTTNIYIPKFGNYPIHQQKNWVYIHWGHHKHKTNTLTSGERHSVILWFK